jgi:hypothetical protein
LANHVDAPEKSPRLTATGRDFRGGPVKPLDSDRRRSGTLRGNAGPLELTMIQGRHNRFSPPIPHATIPRLKMPYFKELHYAIMLANDSKNVHAYFKLIL